MALYQLLPLLLLLLPGYIALEIASHITPKAFRATGEGQKTLVTLAMGLSVFCLFSGVMGVEPRDGWHFLANFQELTWSTVRVLLLTSMIAGFAWALFILFVIPLGYRVYDFIGSALKVPVFAGFHSIFERAVKEFDHKEVSVYLKSNRVVFGSIMACPSQDGDERGLLMRLTSQGVIRNAGTNPWSVDWDDLRPEHQQDYYALLYVPASEIVMIRHLPDFKPEPEPWQGLEKLNPRPPQHPAEELGDPQPLPPRPAVTSFVRPCRPRKGLSKRRRR